MAAPPQLPSGYQLDPPAGAPKPPAGYQFDGTQPNGDTYQGGFLHHLGSSLWNAGVGLVNAVTNPAGGLAGSLVQSVYNQTGGWGRPSQAAQEWQQRTAEGRSLPYRIMAPLAETVTPLNVQAQEEAARRGDVGGVAGEAVGAGTIAAAPLAVEGAARAANRVIPSTTRAGAGLQALETRYADHPVEPNQFAAATAKIQQELDTVGAKVPDRIQHVMDRVQQADAEARAGVQGGQGPLTFKEARTILKQFNDQIDFRNPNPTDRLYQRAAGALDQDITTSVAQPSQVAPKGFLPDYLRMANEYRRGKQIIRAGEAAGPFIGGGVGAYLGRGAGGAVAAEAAGGGALLGRVVGKPTVGAMTRALIERQGGAPNISLPPEAPAPPVPAAAAPAATPPPAPPAEVSGAPGGVERRTDIAARQHFAQLSPQEQYEAAFTNHVTGLPNARAFDWIRQREPAAPSYGFSDVAGLKWLNDTHGMEAGNALLQAKARALQEAGISSFHTGGDEFTHVSPDPVNLNNRLAAANQNLRNAVIEFRDAKTGQLQHYTGAEFRYGVGSSPEQAQAGMMARKAAGKATRGTQGMLRRVPPPAPPPGPVEATP